LIAWTGTTYPYFYLDQVAIPESCTTSTCTIGFALASDEIYVDYGVAITDFSISTVTLNNYTYELNVGTSMAAPHVAGLAALIWALNPGYSYKDVIESIKNGGEPISSLTNKTSTGKAVNALGSLRYVKPPAGVTIIKQ